MMTKRKCGMWLRPAMMMFAALACMSSGVSAADVEQDTAYRLDSGDRIKVTVYGHDDLSGEFELDSEGMVAMPLIQDVQAGGLTVAELERAVTDKLSPDFLKNPRVSIEVLNYRPFYILGEVREPGSYPYASGMTLIKAVAMAGGYTYRARTSRVTITRPGDETPVQIKADPDTLVMPGDVIEVPERFF